MRFWLYVDEDTEDTDLVAALRAEGMNVLTAEEAGMLQATDSDQLAFATREERVMLTSNRADFNRLHRRLLDSGQHHTGIILVHQQRFSVGESVRRLNRMWLGLSKEDFRDRLEWLNAWGSPRA
jgi:hypothetical protein